MNKNRLAFGLLAADLGATLLLYSRLPETVPVHWNFSGNADRFGSRWEILLLGPGVLLLCWALMIFLVRIDPLAARPLEADAPPAEQGAFGVLIISMMALGLVGHIGLLLSIGGLVQISPRISGLFAPALLCVIGNFLPRVRPNYFAGLRTPWTLSSAKVWRRTHRLSGRLLFFGGLLCALLVLLGSSLIGFAFIAVLVLGIGGPAVASYVWWREEKAADRS